jgi:hypothetical protein
VFGFKVIHIDRGDDQGIVDGRNAGHALDQGFDQVELAQVNVKEVDTFRVSGD